MIKERLSGMVRVAMLGACLWCGCVAAAEEAAPAGAAAPAQAMDKKQVSRMRGKLLYKKSQIRRLERAAVASNAQVAQKAADLERQRREMYLAVEPKLAALYEAQDQLDVQIKEAAAQLKRGR